MSRDERRAAVRAWALEHGSLTEPQIQRLEDAGVSLEDHLKGLGLRPPEVLLFGHESRFGSKSNLTATLARFAKLPKPGERFAGARIIEELGRGGMGAVYGAEHLTSGDRIAIKLRLPLPNEDGTSERRFQREVESLERLRHPRLLTLHRSGHERGFDYYITDWLEGGESLGRYARGSPESRAAALTKLVALAEALDHAHSLGIIHRDLKPANMLVDGDEQPWLLDFGLAAELDDQTRLTQSGSAIGTPAYMAPEQCLGDRELDPRTDVYGLGAVLYELLTDTPPFSAASPTALVAQIITCAPKRPSRVRRDVCRRVESVCLKALSKDKGKRYRRAGSFARDLHRALSGERPVALARSSRTQVMRAIATLAAIATIALIGQQLSLRGRAEKRWTGARVSALVKRAEQDIERLETQLGGATPAPSTALMTTLSEAHRLAGQDDPRLATTLGRAERLVTEHALQTGDEGGAARALARAEALLGGTGGSRILRAPRGLLALAQGRRAEAIEELREATRVAPRRVDLKLALACALEKHDPSAALTELEHAAELGGYDRDLELLLLIALGRHRKAVAMLEERSDLKARPEHIEAYLGYAAQAAARRALQATTASLAKAFELGPRAPQAAALVAIGLELIATELDDDYRRFKGNDKVEGLIELVRLIDQAPVEAPRKRALAARLSKLAGNLSTLPGHDVDRHATLLCELSCLWGPEDEDSWLRLSSEQIWKSSPPEVIDRIIGYRDRALKRVVSPRSHRALASNYQRLYHHSNADLRGLRGLRPPSDEELRSWPWESGEQLYWRALSLRRLGRLDQALEQCRKLSKFSLVRARQIQLIQGELLLELERREEALRCFLTAARMAKINDDLGDWRRLTSLVMRCAAPSPPPSSEALSPILSSLGSRFSALTLAYQSWLSSGRGERARATKLLERIDTMRLTKSGKAARLALIAALEGEPNRRLSEVYARLIRGLR